MIFLEIRKIYNLIQGKNLLILPKEPGFLSSQFPYIKQVEFECKHILVKEQTDKLMKKLIVFLL